MCRLPHFGSIKRKYLLKAISHSTQSLPSGSTRIKPGTNKFGLPCSPSVPLHATVRAAIKRHRQRQPGMKRAGRQQGKGRKVNEGSRGAARRRGSFLTPIAFRLRSIAKYILFVRFVWFQCRIGFLGDIHGRDCAYHMGGVCDPVHDTRKTRAYGCKRPIKSSVPELPENLSTTGVLEYNPCVHAVELMNRSNTPFGAKRPCFTAVTRQFVLDFYSLPRALASHSALQEVALFAIEKNVVQG